MFLFCIIVFYTKLILLANKNNYTNFIKSSLKNTIIQDTVTSNNNEETKFTEEETKLLDSIINLVSDGIVIDKEKIYSSIEESSASNPEIVNELVKIEQQKITEDSILEKKKLDLNQKKIAKANNNTNKTVNNNNNNTKEFENINLKELENNNNSKDIEKNNSKENLNNNNSNKNIVRYNKKFYGNDRKSDLINNDNYKYNKETLNKSNINLNKNIIKKNNNSQIKNIAKIIPFKKTPYNELVKIDFNKTYFDKYFNKKYLFNTNNILNNSFFSIRETNTKGQKLTLAFLNYEFGSLNYKGIYKNSFIQSIKINQVKINNVYLKHNNNELDYGKDYYFNLNQNQISESNINLIFAGKGTSIEILKACEAHYNKNLKNGLLITPSNLFNQQALYYFLKKIKNKFDINFLFIMNNNIFQLEDRNLILNSNSNNLFKHNRIYIKNSFYNSNFIPTIILSYDFWNKIYEKYLELNKLKKYIYSKNSKFNILEIEPLLFNFAAKVEIKDYNVGNLVALCNNYDERKENVIVSSNYDSKNITNCNSTGIASVLTLSQIFSKVYLRKDLNKNLIFILYVGKHENNIGSKLYSWFPGINHFKTFINIDIDELGEKPNSQYLLHAGYSKNYLLNFNQYIKKINYKNSFDNSINDLNLKLYTTDAWQLGKLNIPYIYFTSTKPDEILKQNTNIDEELLIKRVKYISNVIWQSIIYPEDSKTLIQKKALLNSINMRD